MAKKKTGGGTVSGYGIKPLSKKTAAYMKKHKIGLEFKIAKDEKFVFKIGRKIVMVIDDSTISFKQ